jgi:predicted SAM-dependent methyltransferase
VDLKINVGCGRSATQGWLNFDSSPSVRLSRLPGASHLSEVLVSAGLLTRDQADFILYCKQQAVRYGDVLRGLPLPDRSCSVVYASHVLEHLHRADEAVSFLRELRRVLQPGGVLRLAVPDLRILIREYLDRADADAFAASLHMVPQRARSGLPGLIGLLTSDRTWHRWIYDEQSLTHLLCDQGFSKIRVLEAGETSIPDHGALNLRERAWESLYVEAQKPVADPLPPRQMNDVRAAGLI